MSIYVTTLDKGHAKMLTDTTLGDLALFASRVGARGRAIQRTPGQPISIEITALEHWLALRRGAEPIDARLYERLMRTRRLICASEARESEEAC
jgi:hypothetical protein